MTKRVFRGTSTAAMEPDVAVESAQRKTGEAKEGVSTDMEAVRVATGEAKEGISTGGVALHAVVKTTKRVRKVVVPGEAEMRKRPRDIDSNSNTGRGNKRQALGHQHDQSGMNGGVATETQQLTSAVKPYYYVNDLLPKAGTACGFVGRVFSKGPVGKYTHWRGKSGSLFTMWVTGKDSQLVKATVFDGGVGKFYEVANPGAVCLFSGGRIKRVNRDFSPHGAAVELSFGDDAYIVEMGQDTIDFPEPGFTMMAIGLLGGLSTGSVVTIIGIVTDVGPLKSIMTKSGKATDRRQFVLVDDSDTELLCTAWGKVARDIEPNIAGTVLLMQDAKISDYMGTRSLNIGVGVSLHYGPALARSHELRNWFQGISAGHQYSKLDTR